MRQCLLFNGWVLVSIKRWTSGSHLPASPTMQSDVLELKDCTGQNVGATCHHRPLISEDVFRYKGRRIFTKNSSSAKQNRPVIFHTSFSNILKGPKFKLWPVPKCCRVTQFRSTHAFDWLHCGQNIRLNEIRQPLFHKAGRKE